MNLEGSVIMIIYEFAVNICCFADWLEKTLSETRPTPKLVTVVNPGNPSGTYIPEPLLKVLCPSYICYRDGLLFFMCSSINEEVLALPCGWNS